MMTSNGFVIENKSATEKLNDFEMKLKKMTELHDQGVLTDEEFARAKNSLIDKV